MQSFESIANELFVSRKPHDLESRLRDIWIEIMDQPNYQKFRTNYYAFDLHYAKLIIGVQNNIMLAELKLKAPQLIHYINLRLEQYNYLPLESIHFRVSGL